MNIGIRIGKGWQGEDEFHTGDPDPGTGCCPGHPLYGGRLLLPQAPADQNQRQQDLHRGLGPAGARSARESVTTIQEQAVVTSRKHDQLTGEAPNGLSDNDTQYLHSSVKYFNVSAFSVGVIVLHTPSGDTPGRYHLIHKSQNQQALQ